MKKPETRRKILFSFLVAALFLVPVLRTFELPRFLEHIRRIDMHGLGTAFLILAGANVIRSLRFERLDRGEISLLGWWVINGIYNAVTATFPGGVGEAVTAFAIRKTTRNDFLISFRILILSRVMDLGCISLLLLITALSGTGARREVAIGVSFFFLAISAILLVPATERFVVKKARNFLPANWRFAGRLRSELESLSAAVDGRRDVAPYVTALACSIFVVGFSAFSVHEVIRALGADFSWVQSFYCFGIYALFQLIPLQGFAGIGTQAAWWMVALNAAGYRGPDAAAMGLILHGIFYLFIMALALLSLVWWRYLGVEKG